MGKQKRDRSKRHNQHLAAPDPRAKYVGVASTIDRHIPTLFLSLAIPIGLLYALVLPPLQVPDEMMHFGRAYSVSRGLCLASPDIDIPKSFAYLNALFPHWLEQHRRISINDLREALSAPLDDRDMAGNGRQRALEGFINQNLCCCVPYVPAAVTLIAGRHIGFSPLALMYMARITNLGVYLLMTFAALRLLPDFRFILFCAALMPMAMHQAASVSADSLVFAAMFLFCAYVVRLAFTRDLNHIGRRQHGALALLIVFIVLSKSLIAVAVLVLLIPSARFGSRRNKWISVSAYLLLGLVCIGLWQHLNQANVQRLVEERSAREVDVPGNIRFMYSHPVELASIFVRSAIDPDYLYVNLQGVVGRLGWLTIQLPDWLVWLYFGVLLAAAGTQTRDIRLPPVARGVILAFVAAAVANTMASMWSLETPKYVLDHPAVWGRFRVYSQGRYWVPLVFPLLLLITTARTRFNPRSFTAIAIAVVLIASGVALYEIRGTYYL